MHRPIFLERSVARNRSLSGYAPHARVELDLGNVPRRLQAKRGGEEGFDLGAHAVRGRCQSRAVLPPIVMSVEKSISTRNGMEPRTLPGPPHSERISGLWISPIKSWLSVVSPAGHSSPNPANLGSFITLCASDSVKDILQIRSLASTRVMSFECGGPANPPKANLHGSTATAIRRSALKSARQRSHTSSKKNEQCHFRRRIDAILICANREL